MPHFPKFGILIHFFSRRHACGENPSEFPPFTHHTYTYLLEGRVYGNTRMDTFWAFRQACVIQPFRNLFLYICHRYDTARQLKEQQDAYCTRALAGEWEGLGEFPDNLQWEALVDVLRGRVKACFSIIVLLCGTIG